MNNMLLLGNAKLICTTKYIPATDNTPSCLDTSQPLKVDMCLNGFLQKHYICSYIFYLLLHKKEHLYKHAKCKTIHKRAVPLSNRNLFDTDFLLSIMINNPQLSKLNKEYYVSRTMCRWRKMRTAE